MSENCDYIDSILRRNGRDQQQRFNKILNPDSLKLHDLDIEDWMLFAYNFAKNVNYFDNNSDDVPVGNWQDLFRYFNFNEETIPLRGESDYEKIKNEITQTLAEQEKDSGVTPHFTLFICFLRLLSFSQTRFNGLTKRHLDFYYKEILKVEKLPAHQDKVHLLFEIAKKSASERIEEGTELDGGKDKNGSKRVFKTSEELVANKTSIALLKNIYNHQEDGVNGIKRELKAANMANSFDGNGEDFPEGQADWWPFGYPSSVDPYPPLPNAKTGFSLTSPLLELKEGERTIDILISYQVPANPGPDDPQPIIPFPAQSFPFETLQDNITIFCSGESGWLGPYELENSSVLNPGSMLLSFKIARDEPSVVNYNKEIHLEDFDTKHPVVRFLIDQSSEDGYDINRRLAINTLNSIKVDVNVTDIVSLELENDTGVLNVKKPFYPFTTDPIKRSNFIMNYPEVFRKPWETIDIDIIWRDTPDFDNGFQDQYAYYDRSDVNDTYFKFTPAILNREIWNDKVKDSSIELFNSIDTDTKIYKTSFTYDNPAVSSNPTRFELGKNGPLRFSLDQSFLQELYPTKYALAISKEILADPPTTPPDPPVEPQIPKEPYIPLIETITMGYSASDTTTLKLIDGADNETQQKKYENNLIKLFHESPFGQYEEHEYLKSKVLEKNNEKLEDNGSFLINHLVPQHCRGGSLFIGLENAEIGQQVSLLIQVLEGSENPLTISFEGKERVEWSILCDNHWKDLQNDILKNSTDNLLTSGIVKFGIPKQVTDQNTRLPRGYVWLRARIHKNYDAVSKAKTIHTQAVLAEFEDRNNELSHLETGLPNGSISKLITRVPQIKSITQPYNSFDGQPQESDDAYYRRISERLRHKNRAITLWDYENLVLQEFPEIYQVKCLNHTNVSSFLSPGNVTLVVIPDTINKNVFDIFQPRVSRATLNKVKTFVNRLNSMHVETEVINPTYEEVEISLAVKFYDQYDENFYTKQLSEDITQFLSPWAFDTSRSIDFGVTLHRSVLIDYLEKLFYVDYLQDVVMKKNDENFLTSIEPSNPASILVSAREHIVSTDIEKCGNQEEKEIDTCQA
ncbi:baseplate J/gp47 family protein [Aquimarina sp. AU474]|uniref:baseplate J/gp47 family protein n=1 Tax=Aquimarina sp. AU474 TaxID=2108529 RepID=UPI000D694A14|nr:baseplate J/gp47 family protein [Aquimarina sp. AU474]